MDDSFDSLHKWPFSLKKECLDPVLVMLLLGLCCGLKGFSKETLPSGRGSLCQHTALLNPAHKSIRALQLAWMFLAPVLVWLSG